MEVDGHSSSSCCWFDDDVIAVYGRAPERKDHGMSGKVEGSSRRPIAADKM
jgi:hypothetical protein